MVLIKCHMPQSVQVLKFGGIDMVLRTLTLYKPEEDIGYNGIIDLFSILVQGHGDTAMELFLKHLPRTQYFMEEKNWTRWIQPRLHGRAEGLTRQQVCMA